MERRPLADGIAVLTSPTLEARGCAVVFTERTGGVSTGPFDSLNLGFGTGDAATRVRRNRERLRRALDIAPFAVGEQVHGVAAARVGAGRAGAGFRSRGSAIPRADALIASHRGRPVAVLAADCVPVVLAWDGRVAVVHAGWRGMAGGIVGRVVERVGEPPPAAAIGPAIGPCHYEVGEDVAAAVAGGSPAGARVERRGERTFLDLAGTVEGVLRLAGVTEVDRAGECTACHADRFFSHRRDGTTGRQAAVAWLR
jgi:YfiH family protein